MSKLTLNWLACHVATDGSDTDEVQIWVNGVLKWHGIMVQDGGIKHTPLNKEASFSGTAKIRIVEADRASNPDLIGDVTAKSSEEGQGELRAWLTGDGSGYDFAYEVLAN